MLRGIRTRLLGLVIATVVPFTALIGGGLWNQWRGDQAQAFRSALIEARLLAARVDDQITELDNLLIGLSQAVSTDPADMLTNDAMFRHAKTELPGYIGNLLLSAPNGSNIGTSFAPAESGRTYIGDRDYFGWIVADREGVAVGNPVLGRTTGQWVTTVARGIRNPAGGLAAIIGVGIQIEHFQNALTVHDLPAGSIVQIISRDGSVILRNDDAGWVGRKLSDNEFAALHSASKEASAAVLWPDHIERITGSAAMVAAPWLVSVGLPTEYVLSNVVSRLAWGTAASLITLLVALALASAFSGRIISPLRQLSEDASALAAGDLTHRTAVATQDEVGALANTFNAMAASLEARHRELDLAREAAFDRGDRARAAGADGAASQGNPGRRDRCLSGGDRLLRPRSQYRALEPRRRADIRLFRRGDRGQRTKLVPPEAVTESQDMFERCLNGETIRDVEVRRQRKDGSIVDIRLAATPMYNPDGTVWGVAWAYDDITGRKKAERQLNQIAHYDQLTGLPNRVSLKNELTSLLSADGRPIALDRAVRSRRLQGRQRHRRSFDRRPAAGRGGAPLERRRRRRRQGVPARRRRVRGRHPGLRRSAPGHRARRVDVAAAGRAVRHQ